MEEFAVTTAISAPPALAFDLARDMSVHGTSTGRGRERAVAGVTSGVIGPGERVTFRATHFGVPFTLTSRVTDFDRPRCFVDEQVSGPFRSWHHRHEFRPGPAGTVMTDRVRLEAPFGPLGRLVERLVLVRYMRGLVVARGAWVAEVDGADAVVHLSGRRVDVRATRRHIDELISSRVEPVRVMGEAVRACSSPPRAWVQSGSLAIFARAATR